MKQFLALLACVALAACTTTNVRKVNQAQNVAPITSTRGLLVQPDVNLYVLTAAGMQERREDWSRMAQTNLAEALKAELSSRTKTLRVLDPQVSMDGRVGQLIRLNSAVGASVAIFEYGPLKLPTKRGAFDWTLGDGAKLLGEAQGADYALFVSANGTYASAGRKALMVGAALFGVAVPLGQQQIFASVVDLHTGRLVWTNVATAGPSADIRSAEGARSLATSLLKDIPV